MANVNESVEVNKDSLFSEYQEWLKRYQIDKRAVMMNFCLMQMRAIKKIYQEQHWDIEELRTITPGEINVGWW